METHNIKPVFDFNSEILILGSFPSEASRAFGFYYAHPRNRFWQVMAEIFQVEIGSSPQEKTEFLIKRKIALWDSVARCSIHRSGDSTIKDAVPNDIEKIIRTAKIKHIYFNGNKSYEIFLKYCRTENDIPLTVLPSTSPANARFTLEKLCEVWKIISE